MDVKVKPFDVPRKVYLDLPQEYTGIRGGAFTQATAVSLDSLSVKDLDKLCEDFRIAVFKAAGKNDPSYRAYF